MPLLIAGGQRARSRVNILGQFTDVSTDATNLIALIGLGVAIDYSLFIISRFREELAAGRMVPDALAITVATAGRAIVFSSVTVACSPGRRWIMELDENVAHQGRP